MSRVPSQSIGALEARHAALVRDCAAEREEAARHSAVLMAGCARVDHELARLKAWAVHPGMIAAGVALAVVLVRSWPLRTIGTVLGLMPPIVRIASARRRIHREVPDVR